MRLSICAALIASVNLVGHCTAAPSFKASSQAAPPTAEAVDMSKRDNEEVLKYFHEAGDDEILGHYDRRYFHGVVTDEERTDTQAHMIRAYLTFFRNHGLDTWIAHGTLLGWWWNGKRLPWDYDLDTQVSSTTLNRLGELYNQTKYLYTSSDGMVKREYLIDVNPWIFERVRGDGMNVIDARWIDVRNGLYVDITGLSETNPATNPGVWSCKNYHEYKIDELYPMRESMFEGVMAKVPYAYDKILTDEYQTKALVVTNFNGHMWEPKLREWVKSPETIQREEELRLWREQEEKARALDNNRLG
ncbi:LicD family-domain-containing protein [Paraphoma chrysanthemicola]|nr:LicD family-domain-containing protein [Paraphoma chrysanthemicola]